MRVERARKNIRQGNPRVQRPGGETEHSGNREEPADQSGCGVVTKGEDARTKLERRAPTTQGLDGSSQVPALHLKNRDGY